MADTPATADPVAARLAEVKRRAGYVTASAMIGVGANQAARDSAADVPRLLAVAEVVLKLHRPESACDPAHPRLLVCDRCNQPWPCYEYEAVSRALVGEEPPDGT